MRRVFLILLIWCASLAHLSTPAGADVLGVRALPLPGGARIAVELSAATEFRVFALGDPARVVIDLPKTQWRAERPDDIATVGIAKLRHGLFRPTVYRLVFDLATTAAVVAAKLAPSEASAGKRLLVDLAYGQAPGKERFGKLIPAPVADPPQMPKPPRRPRLRTIVLDAGHGGVDPGAIGPGGVVEKRVNLAVAKAIRERLEARPGYQVVMTRDRDIFLRLRERVRRGRASNADLFISIHADSHPNPGVSGASLYTLSETASDKEAERLAHSENRADLIGGAGLDEEPAEVYGILLDLAQRETHNESSAAADDLLFALAANQPLLTRPKRAAGFAVLKAPDVPSVLIELGYLSNTQDATRLNDPEGRERIARAIAEGVFRYFDGANTARAQQAQ